MRFFRMALKAMAAGTRASEPHPRAGVGDMLARASRGITARTPTRSSTARCFILSLPPIRLPMTRTTGFVPLHSLFERDRLDQGIQGIQGWFELAGR